MAEKVLKRWLFLIVAVCVAAVYLQALGGTFVWDDRHLILKSPQISGDTPFWQHFVQPFWMDPSSDLPRAYYRPLVVWSFALDYRLHGENAAGYHLTNVALHTLNALLFAGVLRKYRVSAASALLVTLAWALSPRLSEAVAWISGRTDVLATTFVFLALLIHRPGNAKRGVLAALCLFFGLLAKEVAIAGFSAILVSELTADRAPPSSKLKRIAPLGLALAGYFVLRASALQGVYASLQSQTAPVDVRWPLGLEALARYVIAVANPWVPELQQGLLRHPNWPLVAFGAVLLVAALLGLVLSYPRVFGAARSEDAPAALRRVALALGLTSLGLVLHVAPIWVNVASADRFLYLPLAGLGLGLAHPLARLLARTRAALAVATIYVLTLAAACFVHVDTWGDELRLWARAYRTTPSTNGLPGTELANLYYRAGLYEPALTLYQRTLDSIDPARNPGLDDILRANIAKAQSHAGSYEEAAKLLHRLCATSTVARDCLAAARVELHQLHLDRARSFAREAQARAPQVDDAANVLRQIDAVDQALRTPELNGKQPLARTSAQFEVMSLAGNEPAALALAEVLLREPTASASDKTKTAEYWVRWGHPARIQSVLASASNLPNLDDGLLLAAQHRITEGEHLMSAWPELEKAR